MRAYLLTAVMVSILASGCGRAALTPHAEPPPRAAARSSEDTAKPASDRAAVTVGAEPQDAAPAREPGDYVSYRFSGSFRKAPLTLTQRVVAREGSVLVVDLTLDEGGATEALRVRMSEAPATRGEVLSVERIDPDGGHRRATTAEYEEILAKTALAADENQAELGDEAVTVDVGGVPLACREVSYRVRVGKSSATMRTIQSDAFPWGDVGGEITADDGRVLYRAELIGAGRIAAPPAPAQRGSSSGGAAVAASGYDD